MLRSTLRREEIGALGFLCRVQDDDHTDSTALVNNKIPDDLHKSNSVITSTKLTLDYILISMYEGLDEFNRSP